MAALTYFEPRNGRPGKRWRYLVQEDDAAAPMVFDGGWYFTSRVEAAEHCRRLERSSGGRYSLTDRARTKKAR
ncbi:hypothetical protein PMI01_02199 [Caulobacter sp. AP07]|uniref:hypothetical protein n=1 Tax=Caulobacter sp. AP07 TaxID=1144304 RepID=UPI0002722026|nr:hypothetical protein [Caulobacter sp. AP07]EJL33237.1 hypothetical protein PMI01_02199 [Caulobacter sp. AP07]